jgi:hypothetical protein
MKNTKMQILKEAVEKHGSLTAAQVRQLARKHGYSEKELLDCYLEYFYEDLNEKQ